MTIHDTNNIIGVPYVIEMLYEYSGQNIFYNLNFDTDFCELSGTQYTRKPT